MHLRSGHYRELSQFDALGPAKAETAVGLAVLPRDGFACLRSDGPDRGEMVTRSLQFSGHRLHIHCEMTGTSPGEIKVELMEPNYFPIDGCSMEAAAPLTSTGLDTVVTWNGNADIGRLAGRTIKLRMSVNEREAVLVLVWGLRTASATSWLPPSGCFKLHPPHLLLDFADPQGELPPAFRRLPYLSGVDNHRFRHRS